jgi:hypothetical protein
VLLSVAVAPACSLPLRLAPCLGLRLMRQLARCVLASTHRCCCCATAVISDRATGRGLHRRQVRRICTRQQRPAAGAACDCPRTSPDNASCAAPPHAPCLLPWPAQSGLNQFCCVMASGSTCGAFARASSARPLEAGSDCPLMAILLVPPTATPAAARGPMDDTGACGAWVNIDIFIITAVLLACCLHTLQLQLPWPRATPATQGGQLPPPALPSRQLDPQQEEGSAQHPSIPASQGSFFAAAPSHRSVPSALHLDFMVGCGKLTPLRLLCCLDCSGCSRRLLPSLLPPPLRCLRCCTSLSGGRPRRLTQSLRLRLLTPTHASAEAPWSRVMR